MSLSNKKAALTAACVVALIVGAPAPDPRPFQWSGNGEYAQNPVKSQVMTYEYHNDIKDTMAMMACIDFCDEGNDATPDFYLLGNMYMPENSDQFTCNCYDSRSKPTLVNSTDTEWSRFQCYPHRWKGFPCYKTTN